MVTLASAWSLLEQAERDAWDNYGAQTSKTNRLGATIYVSGRNWFISNNSLRLQAGLAQVDSGPAQTGLAQYSAPVMTCTSGSAITVAFTNTDEWSTSSGGALLVFTSRGKQASTNFFKGPYKFAGKIQGAASAPTSPANITMPFTIANGERVFWRALAVTLEGRITAEATGFCAAAIS